MVRIDFEPTFPPELRSVVSDAVRRHEALVPSWCRSLWCRFTQSEDAEASVTPQMEYRRAILFIHPHWLTTSADERERDIVHELCHLASAPMVCAFDAAVAAIGEDGGKAADVLKEMMRQAHEGTTQDIAEAWLSITLDRAA